jgi:hypothetical protein
MRLRHLAIAKVLAVVALAVPATAAADRYNFRGVDPAASSCSAQEIAPGLDTAVLSDPAQPGRLVLCRRVTVPELDRSNYASLACSDADAPYRGAHEAGDVVRDEWDFSSAGWVVQQYSDDGGVELANWGWAERSADVFVGCYPEPTDAVSTNWSGLDFRWLSAEKAAAKIPFSLFPYDGFPGGVFVATADGDDFDGTDGDDQARAARGNDRVDGGGGNDLLLGERGNDVLVGGPGNDSLFDNRGRDTLKGGRGTDRFSSADFNTDVIRCGPGKDTVVADPEDDVGRDCEQVHWLQA